MATTHVDHFTADNQHQARRLKPRTTRGIGVAHMPDKGCAFDMVNRWFVGEIGLQPLHKHPMVLTRLEPWRVIFK